MAVEPQKLYIKVNDEFILYDESEFWTVSLTSPDKEKVIRGKARQEEIDTFSASLIDRRDGKPVGRKK